jgi:hypothetical protein
MKYRAANIFSQTKMGIRQKLAAKDISKSNCLQHFLIEKVVAHELVVIYITISEDRDHQSIKIGDNHWIPTVSGHI